MQAYCFGCVHPANKNKKVYIFLLLRESCYVSSIHNFILMTSFCLCVAEFCNEAARAVFTCKSNRNFIVINSSLLQASNYAFIHNLGDDKSLNGHWPILCLWIRVFFFFRMNFIPLLFHHFPRNFALLQHTFVIFFLCNQPPGGMWWPQEVWWLPFFGSPTCAILHEAHSFLHCLSAWLQALGGGGGKWETLFLAEYEMRSSRGGWEVTAFCKACSTERCHFKMHKHEHISFTLVFQGATLEFTSEYGSAYSSTCLPHDKHWNQSSTASETEAPFHLQHLKL